MSLRSENEKNRKVSTVPLRSDLAGDLRGWVEGRPIDDLVFNVPAGLLRIFDRDLVAAGIDKIDERGRRVHFHALRMSTATHLSAAGVAPRTAQALMRHSDMKLTMATYTDERLLNSAGAVELLPDLPLNERAEVISQPIAGKRSASFVAPTVAPTTGETCQTRSFSGKMGKVSGPVDKGPKNEKTGV